MTRFHVLKFGSSVLQSPADLPSAAKEIMRFRESGRHVVAVVSAFSGETDRRIAEADRLGLASDSPARAELIAAGEFESAAALSAHLGQQDIDSIALPPSTFDLRADGPRVDAAPVSLDRHKLRHVVEDKAITIVPGYSGIDANGDTVLLGRGGSDLSALFLAAELGEPACRLIKDVDGLYDKDPNKYPDAKRYLTVSTQMAYRIGGVLVQPKAISYAEMRTLTIEVAKAGQPDSTRIYPGASNKLKEHS